MTVDHRERAFEKAIVDADVYKRQIGMVLGLGRNRCV